jgi:CheY-like chemotaxis protein
MDEQLLKQLFQAPPEKDVYESYEGRYLSLAITKKLIELQNGKFDIRCRDGGVVYSVSLKFKVVKAKQKAAQKPPEPNYSHLTGKRILVVEDNKINQLVVAKLLKKLNVEVTTADNGEEALKAFEQENFDLVLMDIQMPVMDGYRATKEIRRLPDEWKRDVPIIALTASAFLTEKEKAQLFGMNDHVGKPFSPDELLEKVSACLEMCRKPD